MEAEHFPKSLTWDKKKKFVSETYTHNYVKSDLQYS